MTHEPKYTEQEQPKKTLSQKARDLGGKILVSVGEVIEDGIVGSVGQVSRVKVELTKVEGEIAPQIRRNLDVLSSGIVTGPEGPRKNQTDLMQVIFTGDSVLGLVRTSEPGRNGYREITDLSIVELPYGVAKEFAGSSKDLSPRKVVASVDPRALKNRLKDGAVQEWETIIVGRLDTLMQSDSVSRKQFEFTVTADCHVDVVDVGSTNGTSVLDVHGLNEIINGNNALRSDTEKLVADLQSNPTKFDPSLAGLLVPIERK